MPDKAQMPFQFASVRRVLYEAIHAAGWRLAKERGMDPEGLIEAVSRSITAEDVSRLTAPMTDLLEAKFKAVLNGR